MDVFTWITFTSGDHQIQKHQLYTLLGDDLIELNNGDVYTDAGATAVDNYDGDLTASIVVGGDHC